MRYHQKLRKEAMAAGRVANKPTPYLGKGQWMLVDFNLLPENSPISTIRRNISSMYLDPSSEGNIYYKFVLQNGYSTPIPYDPEDSFNEIQKEIKVREAFVKSLSLRDLDEEQLKRAIIDIQINHRMNEIERERGEAFNPKTRAKYIEEMRVEEMERAPSIPYESLYGIRSRTIPNFEKQFEPYITDDLSKADPRRFRFDPNRFNELAGGICKSPQAKGEKLAGGASLFDPKNPKLLRRMYMRFAQKAEDHPAVENNGEIAMLKDSLRKVAAVEEYNPNAYIMDMIDSHPMSEKLHQFYDICKTLGLQMTIPSWQAIAYNRYAYNFHPAIVELTRSKNGNVNLFDKLKKYIDSLSEEERAQQFPESDEVLRQQLYLALTLTYPFGGKMENYVSDGAGGYRKRPKGSKDSVQTPSTPQGLLLQTIGPSNPHKSRKKNFTTDQIRNMVEYYENIVAGRMATGEPRPIRWHDYESDPDEFLDTIEKLEAELYSNEYGEEDAPIDYEERFYKKLELYVMKYQLCMEIRNNIEERPPYDPESYMYMYDELCKMFLDYHTETFGQATLLRNSAIRGDGYLANTDSFKETSLVREPFLTAPRTDDMYELTLSVRYAYSTDVPHLAITTLGNSRNARLYQKYRDEIIEELRKRQGELEHVTMTAGAVAQIVPVTDVEDFFDRLSSATLNPDSKSVLVLRVENQELQYFCGISKCTKRWMGRLKSVPVITPYGDQTVVSGRGSIRAPVGKAGAPSSMLSDVQRARFQDEEIERKHAETIEGDKSIDGGLFAEGEVKMNSWEAVVRYAQQTYGLPWGPENFPTPKLKEIPTSLFDELNATQKRKLTQKIGNSGAFVMTKDTEDIIKNHIISNFNRLEGLGSEEEPEDKPQQNIPTQPIIEPDTTPEEDIEQDELDPELAEFLEEESD